MHRANDEHLQISMTENNLNGTELAILYKYISADRVKNVLPEIGNGTLRATQPAALNDPLECASICGVIYPTKEEERREMICTLNSIVPGNSLNSNDVQRAQTVYGTQAWNELFRIQLSLRFGVVSFSSSPTTPLLWVHYADGGAGVVVGYCASVLKSITIGNERLAAVNYMENLPEDYGYVIYTDEKNLHSALLDKAHYWAYENEWRLTLELKHTIGTSLTDQKGFPINLYRIPNEAVKEVYFTERTPKQTVELIKDRLNNPMNRYGTKKPRKLVLASNKYGYTC